MRSDSSRQDGFYGHSNVTGNLVFEMVRETNDHGPLNSWDRSVYPWTLPFKIRNCFLKIVLRKLKLDADNHTSR